LVESVGLSEKVSRELESLLATIRSDPSVRSIILFGSTALGTNTEQSDIDLLILVDSPTALTVLTPAAIRVAAYGLVTFPLDMIVETVAEFEERKPFPTLERKIAREGKVLYAA